MKKHLLLAIFALSSFSGVLPINWDKDGNPIFKQEQTGILITSDPNYFPELEEVSLAEQSEFLTATDHDGNNLLQFDLANNFTDANKNFAEELNQLDQREWQSWQKAPNGKMYQFSMQCFDPKCRKENFCYQSLRVDGGSHHYKDVELKESYSEKLIAQLEKWNAIENKLFHDELQFLQAQQLVMKRNLHQKFDMVIRNPSQFAQCMQEYDDIELALFDLEQEVLEFKNNRQAFARSHIPSKYFKPLQVARVNFELDKHLESIQKVRENSFESMPNLRKRTIIE